MNGIPNQTVGQPKRRSFRVGICRFCHEEKELYTLKSHACGWCYRKHVKPYPVGRCPGCQNDGLQLKCRGLCDTCRLHGVEGKRVRKLWRPTVEDLSRARGMERLFVDEILPAVERHTRNRYWHCTQQFHLDVIEEARVIAWIEFVRTVSKGGNPADCIGRIVWRSARLACHSRGIGGPRRPAEFMDNLHGTVTLEAQECQARADQLAAWQDQLPEDEQTLLSLLLGGADSHTAAKEMGITLAAVNVLHASLQQHWLDRKE